MKRFFSSLGKALCYGLLFFVLQLIAVFMLSIVSGMASALSGLFVFAAIEMWITENLVALSTILSCLFLICVLLLFFAARRKRFSRELGFAHVYAPMTALFHPFAAGFGMCILATFAISVIPFPDSVTAVYEQYAGQVAGGNPFWMFLATVLFAPLSEEILFRGLIYSRMKQGMPALLAALLSALIFGVMHGTLLHLVYTVPMGLILCLFYEKYGSLWAAIALHMGFNLCGSVLSYYPMDTLGMVIAFLVIGVYLTVVGLLSIAWYQTKQSAAKHAYAAD